MLRLCLISLMICFAMAAPSGAQSYPTKPIRIILPYQPGGIIDFVGRTVAQRLGESIGQPVVVETRTGAGGMTGTSVATQAEPDGYTLLVMDPALVINPSLHANVPYDVFKDLRTISIVGSSPLLAVVSPSLPVKSVTELIAHAKSNPGKLSYASAGLGTTPHLAGELFRIRTGVDATHVPYRGSGPSVPDLMSGKVQFAFNAYVVVKPYLPDEKLRVLAVAGPKRIAALPELPTMAEAGLPDFEVNLWVGIFTHKNVPDAIVNRVNDELRKAVQSSELRAAFANVGVEPQTTTPSEGDAFLKAEFDKWAEVIKRGGVSVR